MSIDDIVDWVNKEGDSLAFTRLCMKCLPALSSHGASLRDATTCAKLPPDAVNSVKLFAEEIVGKSCSLTG